MATIYVVAFCMGAVWRSSVQCTYVEGGLRRPLTVQQCMNIASALNRSRIGRKGGGPGVSEWYQCDKVEMPIPRAPQ